MDLRESIIQEMIDYLNELNLDDVEVLKNNGTYELPYELYNNDYIIIGTWRAKEFLKENFEEFCEAMEYWQENLGQIEDMTNYEKNVNLVYIFVAEGVINEINVDADDFEDIEEYRNELIDNLKNL